MSDGEEQAASLLAESNALHAVKRYGPAAERARAAAALTPGDHRVFVAWARALYGSGEFADAAHAAGEAVRLAPGEAVGHRLRSTSLSALARRAPKAARVELGGQAVASAREAVRLAPGDPNGPLALAEALSVTGAVVEADRWVQEAIRLAPSSPTTWVTASMVAIGARNWNAAADAARQALALDPGNYAALNNLGVALRASGRRREGTRVLAEAARANPDALTARRNLSRAGINIARAAVLIVLLPLCLITNGGIVLYLVVALGSNILISRRPDLVLRAERWAAPVALFFAGRATTADVRGRTGGPTGTAAPGPPGRRRPGAGRPPTAGPGTGWVLPWWCSVPPRPGSWCSPWHWAWRRRVPTRHGWSSPPPGSRRWRWCRPWWSSDASASAAAGRADGSRGPSSSVRDGSPGC